MPGPPGPGGDVHGLSVRALGGDDTPRFGVIAWDDKLCATDDSPPGPSAGTARCASTYPAGTSIDLYASTYNGEGSIPDLAIAWGADASACDTEPHCTIVLDSDTDVTVTFTATD